MERWQKVRRCASMSVNDSVMRERKTSETDTTREGEQVRGDAAMSDSDCTEVNEKMSESMHEKLNECSNGMENDCDMLNGDMVLYDGFVNGVRYGACDSQVPMETEGTHQEWCKHSNDAVETAMEVHNDSGDHQTERESENGERKSEVFMSDSECVSDNMVDR